MDIGPWWGTVHGIAKIDYTHTQQVVTSMAVVVITVLRFSSTCVCEGVCV